MVGRLAQGATAVLALALTAGPAMGSPEPPAVLRAQLPQARLAGAARFTYWGFEVYRARLWVAPGFRPEAWAQHSFALELDYLRSLEGRAIARRSIEEMQRAAPIAAEQARTWESAMRSVFPDVKAGDRITGLHLPGQGARFLVNGKEAGDIRDADFSDRFFGIWLASTTSEPALRKALLAQAAP